MSATLGAMAEIGTETKRRRMAAPERRALIISAALTEFADHGFDRASMGTIAEKAGITRTVLYGHFPSKRALFALLLEDTHRRYLALLTDVLSDGDVGTEARVEGAVDAALDFASADPAAWRLLHPAHAPTDPDVLADQTRIQSDARRLAAQMLSPDAARAGLNPRSSVARGIFAMHQAAMEGLVHWWLAHPRVSRADVREAAVKSIWLGFKGMEEG